jgi:hypothetical protein
MRKPSPAIVIASTALLVALGGTAIAAHHYLITSTSQIKPSVLKSLRGKAGPAGLQGPAGIHGLAGPGGAAGTRGPEGARGPEGSAGTAGTSGPKGATGPEGSAGATMPSTITEVVGPSEPVNKEHPENFSLVECPEGESAVSGGGVTSEDLTGSYANVHFSGWIATARVHNEALPPNEGFVTAYAYCAKTGHAVVASPSTRPH